MENNWLTRTKRLHALASTGTFFGESDFDRERYEEIAAIAEAMLADLTDTPIEKLKSQFPDFGDGYATPKIDVRAAVIRDDSILMVKEKLDGLWTLPGGYADVGYSAAENASKEVFEEAGLKVTATKLYAVFHKSKHAYKPDVRDFYKFYFICEEAETLDPTAGMETLDAAFFPRHELPPLSEGRSITPHIELAFDHLENPGLPAAYD